jgi:hypothetical protein
MSRLDDLVRRMQTQRAVLNLAIDRVKSAGLDGSIVELGLGSGRTFDHLRENFPGRTLVTFDWQMEATKDCFPEKNQFIKGEILKTFPKFAQGKNSTCCLLHIDIGTRDRQRDRELYSSLCESIVSILCENGLLVSDREFSHSSLEGVDTSQHQVEGWVYYLYRRRA